MSVSSPELRYPLCYICIVDAMNYGKANPGEDTSEIPLNRAVTMGPVNVNNITAVVPVCIIHVVPIEPSKLLSG